MKQRDILLLARPDHSYGIYCSLLRTKLRFQLMRFYLQNVTVYNLKNLPAS